MLKNEGKTKVKNNEFSIIPHSQPMHARTIEQPPRVFKQSYSLLLFLAQQL